MSRQAERERFETLLRGTVDALYRTALRFTGDRSVAEDLVQDASLRAYRSFTTGDEPGNFRAWIFRIPINLCIDRSRQKTTAPLGRAVALEPDDLPATDPGPAQNFANARLGRDLTDAVDALADDLRLLVQLVLVEGLSYREAAESLDCPEGTVRSRLARARRLLRASLAEHAPETGGDRVLRFPQSGEKRR